MVKVVIYTPEAAGLVRFLEERRPGRFVCQERTDSWSCTCGWVTHSLYSIEMGPGLVRQDRKGNYN